MEYTVDQNATDDDTNKSASEKHVISSAIVDALSGASTAERQETLDALEPAVPLAVPLAVLVEELPASGGAVEPVRRVRVGSEEEEIDISSAKKRCSLKNFAIVAGVVLVIVSIVFGATI